MSVVDRSAVDRLLTNAPRYLPGLVGFPADEDMVQDCREAILRAVGSWRPERGASFESWAMTKSKWYVIDRYRCRYGRNSRGAAREIHLDDVGYEKRGLVDPGFVVAEDLAVVTSAVEFALGKLPVRRREIVDLVLGGETMAATAGIVGLTPSRVSQIMTVFKNDVRARMRSSQSGAVHVSDSGRGAGGA